ncbi:MAG: AbrB family transcriptional regulator [Bifidobacterium tibiigranuli]|nr:AbrB family transcriptional regulator [Bifidobacterium tibiigranuli]MCI1650440.1 AbrB family transcriptional regulator [Bifidobacterium tibiigranuli]MCI2185990.1 AbrB family transcriptional regulator [Bifidobacterium tibiigranuli]MCI2204035.1 AbrB family transcriptional regulator [Bifidobacterium tibiigranuli]
MSELQETVPQAGVENADQSQEDAVQTGDVDIAEGIGADAEIDSAAAGDAAPVNDDDSATDDANANDNDGTNTNANASEPAGNPDDFEPLTDSYERLRHSHDSAELSEFARRPLPDKANQAAFSRATALLEAVAGNPSTPVEDRVYLAQTMPFPNVLVKLSVDPAPEVRRAVAGNADDKNWLVGRLTKDEDIEVRDIALRNGRTSWKMRLEGAQNPQTGAETLDFLAQLGVELEPDASDVLASMVRRAVALNPQCAQPTLERLAADSSPQVAKAARSRLQER